MIHVIIVKPLEIKLLFVTHCLPLIHSFIHFYQEFGSSQGMASVSVERELKYFNKSQ